MLNYSFYKYFVIPMGLFLIACPAFADVGVPMVLVSFPYMVIALIPIILIEGYVLLKRLRLNRRQAFMSAAVSNIVSTILGIPLTWLVLVIIQIITGGTFAYGLDSWFKKFVAVTWQAPWLIPYEQDLGWMVPVAMMVLLIPFFFVSCWIEYLITRKILKKSCQLDEIKIKKAVIRGNVITYLLLELFVLLFLIYGLL